MAPFRRFVPVLLPFAFCVTAAGADVTPEDVWAAIRSGSSDGVSGVSAGSEKRGEDRLVLSDVVVTSSRKADGTAGDVRTIAATAAELVLRDMGDGSVELTLSPDIVLRSRFKPVSGTETETDGKITSKDFRTVISGTPDSMMFDMSAQAADARFSTTEIGKTEPYIVVTLSSSDARLGLKNGPADAGHPQQDITASLGKLDVSVNDDTPEAVADGKVSMADLSLSGLFNLPDIVDGRPFPGLNIKGRVTLGSAVAAFKSPGSADRAAPVDMAFGLNSLEMDGRIDASGTAAAGDIPAVESTGRFSLGDYSYRIVAADPNGGTATVPGDGSGKGFSGSGSVTVPPLGKGAELGEAIAAGLAIRARVESLEGRSAMTLPESDVRAEISTSAGKGAVEFGLSRSGLIVDIAQDGTALSVRTDAVAGPLDGSIARMSMRVAGPVSPTDAAQPFALGFRFIDVTFGDALWNLFDPERKISRTPATFITDLSGTGRLTADPFADAAPPDDFPLVPETVDLTQFRLALGGAEIAAKGALTFAETGARPVPQGRMSITFKGVYGLLGDLGSVRFIPSEVMLGVRGAIGMVARPFGPDDLVSEFDFRPDGSIWANGTRLPLN